MRMKNSRGISPVVATVLLIALVIVIGFLIFMWMRSLTKEAVTKFDGENIELVCNDAEFRANYASGTLSISNTGNVPIFDIQIRIHEAGGYSTINSRDYTPWPSKGLNQGGAASIDISGSISGATELTLIPILRGSVQSGGQKNYICEEKASVSKVTLE